jgi:hypothetical protein
MKVKLIGAAVLAQLAATSYAEEIKATKKAGGQQIIDSLYGNVEARVTNYQKYLPNGDAERTRMLALRPKLGTKLMSEKLDLNITMPVLNKQNSAESESARPELEQSLTLIDQDRLSVELYSFHYLASEDRPYDGYADLDITFKRTFDRLSVGNVDLSLLVEPEANLTTSKQDAQVSRRERPDGLTVAESEASNEQLEQKETTKYLNLYPKVTLAPAVLPGVKLSLASYFITEFKPEYVAVQQDDGSTKLKDDGYAINRTTQVRYTVRYDINSDVYVYNQLRQNMDGFMAARTAAGLENLTGVVMSLF